MTEEYERFPTLAGAQLRCAAGHFDARRRDGRSSRIASPARTEPASPWRTVLEAVGVDRDAIMADFLRSNDAVPQLAGTASSKSIRKRTETDRRDLTFAEARLTEEVLGVREEYL